MAGAALTVGPDLLRQCFTADTQVVTGIEEDPSGQNQTKYHTRAIQDLKPGDQVLAFDPRSGAVRRQKVLQTFVRRARTLRILEIADSTGELQTIETTNEHPFWLPEVKKFVPAKDLKKGDRLHCPSGEFAVVASVKEVSPAGGAKVYNFEVAHDHTYFVKAHAPRGPPIGVHNADYGDFTGELAAAMSRGMGVIRGQNAPELMVDVLRNMGRPMTIVEIGDAIHQAKRAAGMAGADEIIFDYSGGLWDSRTGEAIGKMWEF